MRSFPLAALVTASLVIPQAATAQQRVVRGGVTYSRPAPVMQGHPAPRPMPVQAGRPGGGQWGGRPTPMQAGKPGGQWGGRPTPVNRPNWNGRPNWGGTSNGRWVGGWRAPGGWNGYRRPVRGYVLPTYWVAPQFFIGNYASYGLSAPPYGYHWSRYYDDAVLADDGGRVWDSVSGIGWDDDGYGYDEGYGYADGGYAYDGGYQGGYAYPERRDSGVGGALIGGAVGAVAGSAIAGRGNRLGGALIGGGVGALAGQAIDKAEDRGRYVPTAPDYGAGYPPPGDYDQRAYDSRGYYGGAPEVVYAPPREHVQPLHVETQEGWSSWRSDGVTVATGSTGGGFYAGGYYHPPATTTVVTVASAPVTTTTVTEYVEEVQTTRAVAKPRTIRKWRPAPKKRATCACQCTCR